MDDQKHDIFMGLAMLIAIIIFISSFLIFDTISTNQKEELENTVTSGQITKMEIVQQYDKESGTSETVYCIKIYTKVFYDYNMLQNPCIVRKVFYVSLEVYESYNVGDYYIHINVR